MSTQQLLYIAERSLVVALARQHTHDGEQVVRETKLYNVIEAARKAAFHAYCEATK